MDVSAKQKKTKRIKEGVVPHYRPEKPTRFWKESHANEQAHLEEFMLQLPEETCEKFKIEGRDKELIVSLDRDQVADMSFPNAESPVASPPRTDPGLNDQLVQFFLNLENGYHDVNNSTLKLNLNFGETSFSLYGIPAKDGFGKGEIFLQNQFGMDQDAPPMRLTTEQRD